MSTPDPMKEEGYAARFAASWAALSSLRHVRHSVRGKLVAMVLLITVLVLLLSGIALLVYDLSVYRTSWAEDMSSEAAILALSTAPALAFDDRDAATRNLDAMRARPNVLAAALYDAGGRLYAHYSVHDEPVPQELAYAPDGVKLSGARAEALRRVEINGEFLGTVRLVARYDVSGRILAYLGIFALITLMSLTLALLLSVSLQKAVTVPLGAITNVARKIVHERTYAFRVATQAEDEIGIVVSAFNKMLDEVQERTTALEGSNAALQQEVAVRQAAEAALARANARLEGTMAAAEIGGWTRSLTGSEFHADRNFAAFYGIADEAEFTANPQLSMQMVHADDREVIARAQAEALATGMFATTQFRIVRRDGSVRWALARGRVQFDAAGKPQSLTGLLIDVTAQAVAEQQRRESESVYRAIGESIDYGIWLCDAAGRNTYASDSFLRLTGLTQDQCSNYGWSEAVHPDDVESAVAAWQESVRSGQPWYHEHRFRGVDGNWHPVLGQGVPVRGDDGSIRSWAGINLDISRLKETEEALREADRRKDEFLATLAHELRNPLAPIRHATYLLGSPAAGEQQRQWGREVIARQVQHMALLLDDLLDVSRITRGRLELKREYVGLDQLVATAVETARPLIETKQHTLTVQLPPQALTLNVDALRMSQALSNLLTNAAKYTDKNGRIELSAAVDAQGLAIEVSDTGIGLSPAAITQVFEMFGQVESALGRSQGGLGIGLALVRGLVKLHGGSVEATSPGPGRGSRFTMRLPASVLESQTPSPRVDDLCVEAGSGPRRSVLVVDDNQDAADSLAVLLQTLGHHTRVEYSGQRGLEAAELLRPAAMILDIGMPGMNGYELARHIRSREWGRGILLIALTGWGQKEDIDRAREAGFDLHFSKPVDVRRIEKELAGLA